MNRLQELSRRLLRQEKPSRVTRNPSDETVRAGRPAAVSNRERTPRNRG